MKVSRIIFGFFIIVVFIFVTYAVLRTVPIDNCGENGTGLACVELQHGFSID